MTVEQAYLLAQAERRGLLVPARQARQGAGGGRPAPRRLHVGDSRSGDWPFPSIAGIVTTPTMRPDGTILAALSLTADAAADGRLAAMPPILDGPTREDALRALTLLEDLIVEFPFVDEVAKAGALSAIITPVRAVPSQWSRCTWPTLRAPAPARATCWTWSRSSPLAR